MSIGILIQPVPPILSLSKIISLSRGLGHSGVFIEFRKTMRHEDGRREGGRGRKGITESLPGGGRKRNVGSLTLAENRELDGEPSGKAGSGGDKGGPSGNLRGIEDLVHSPTRQRAGLAPRNPVLALTHRYLSHDHFRCLYPCTVHTYIRMYIHEASLLLLHTHTYQSLPFTVPLVSATQ